MPQFFSPAEQPDFEKWLERQNIIDMSDPMQPFYKITQNDVVVGCGCYAG
ncbi:hypothetical protein [Chitinophaga sp. HK235]|nr:hypothetical protein [Chitinophaga sp. HK235]